MDNCAVIVETRPLDNLQAIIDQHMACLPGWDLRHYNQFTVRTGEEYNRVLLNPQFWKNLPYDKVLIFQHDSMLLRPGIEAFYDYDFIGAPIAPDRGFPFPAMNGGLSLRSPEVMLACIAQRPREYTPWKHHNEDIYFSYISHQLGFRIPDMDTARTFSVETIFGLGSLGVHAIDKYLSDEEVNQILTQYASAEKPSGGD